MPYCSAGRLALDGAESPLALPRKIFEASKPTLPPDQRLVQVTEVLAEWALDLCYSTAEASR